MSEVRVRDLVTKSCRYRPIDRRLRRRGARVCWRCGDRHLARSTTTLSEMPALRCFFTAEGKLAELPAAYAQEFGVTPRLRADANAGAVVISERGDAKRQIAMSAVR
jgi:hypothetical protein